MIKPKLKPKNKLGTCFDSVFTELIHLQLLIPESEKEITIVEYNNLKDVRVCHGLVIATHPGQEGELAAHAWIEFNADGNDIAYDVIYGVFNPRDFYIENTQASYVVEYTLEEYLINYEKSDYPGPWDKKIKKIADKYSKELLKNE